MTTKPFCRKSKKETKRKKTIRKTPKRNQNPPKKIKRVPNCTRAREDLIRKRKEKERILISYAWCAWRVK